MAISPLMPVYPRCEVEPVRGEGAYLYDSAGKRWLDFASGIAVNLLGHGHPHLTQAIQKCAGQAVGVASLAFWASVQNQDLHASSSSFLMQFSAHAMHICA